jgi:hypothetical protein
MKTFKPWMVVPTALATILMSAGLASSAPIPISPGFKPDPLEFKGTSGGAQASNNCGMIGAVPNHVLSLGANFNYLRFNLHSDGGQPTLLIQTPSGSSCVQADRFSGGSIQAPGYWEQGTYSIYVGDRSGGQHPYTLTITQTP